jgi:hypothetical protein
MGGGMKSSTSQKSTQTNEPPKWAKPMFEKSAAEAQRLYNEGSGYNVYQGPTQAQFSDQRLEGLNNAMKMTGSQSGPITNESVFNNPAIQQARAAIQQQQVDAQRRKVEAAMRAAQEAEAARKAQQTKNNGKYWINNPNSYGPPGYWSDTPYAGPSGRGR